MTLVEFSYNNGYQSSLNMTLYEALFGRRRMTPLNWLESREGRIDGPDLVSEEEDKVKVIRYNLMSSQSRQKNKYRD